MMPIPSGASWNSSNGNISDQFPAGLRVLVVDDDRVCLTILDMMLKKCNYQVTKCSRAEVALSLLRDNKNGFDVVLSDVHMPDMDGFKLLVYIGLEMDLPVIMMSADDSKSVVMKGVTHGACDYLIKPVRMEALGNIWQHVVRKKKHEWKDIEPKANLDDGDRQQQKQPVEPDYSSSANEGHNSKSTKRRKDNEDEAEERDDSSSSKKPRVVWSQELHQQFVTAVSLLGIEKAVPKKILNLMNVPGLTRENVASHLQKFRLYLTRLDGSQQLGGINTSFMGNPDAGGYGSISSLSELDLQALAASGQLNQLPAQSIATLQAVALARLANPKSPISVPLADQRRNVFSFESPKMRYEQAKNQLGNTSRQMNLLHGIPTTMEPKQLAGLQRSFTSMNNQGLILMTGQSQSQTYNHASRQPILPNASVSQASSLLDFTANHITESAGNSFPVRGNLGITSIMSTSTLQREKNLDTRIPREQFVPKYGLSNNVNQNRPYDWGVGLTFDPCQHTNNMQGRLNVLQHIYASGQKTTGIFSTGEGSSNSIHLTDNPSRVKTENVNCGTSCQQFCPQEYSQDDLMNTLFIQQQQQQGIGQPENDIPSDWYSLDNLPA